MSFILDGLSQLGHQFVNLTRLNQTYWYFALSFAARLVSYFALLALLVIIISLILKYLEDCHIGRNLEPVISSETNQLLPGKSNPFSYGTWDTDIESGNCSSSLEELYDEKICIICYDEKRNCFFVPCGHCATCYQCAKRILCGENKRCPVCRRLIGKLRKLIPQETQTSS